MLPSIRRGNDGRTSKVLVEHPPATFSAKSPSDEPFSFVGLEFVAHFGRRGALSARAIDSFWAMARASSGGTALPTCR